MIHKTAFFPMASEAKWEMMLSRDGYLRFDLPDAPNWFHRFMQKLILGIYWKAK